MRFLRRIALALLLLAPCGAGAAEILPPAPPAYCNDYAGVVSANARGWIEQRLARFDRDSSTQVVVAIYPKMESDSSVEDYTVRVAQSWHVGRKGKDNGAVLFVFVADHKLYLQVGYGLEGAIPDAIAKRIVSDAVAPRLRSGDFDGGISAGVEAIVAAAQGEYQRTPSDHAQGQGQARSGWVFFVLIAIIVLFSFFGRTGTYYTPLGSSRRGGLGGWGGGGGFGGGGGGGFSGGGGSFGGGGAGGSW